MTCRLRGLPLASVRDFIVILEFPIVAAVEPAGSGAGAAEAGAAAAEAGAVAAVKAAGFGAGATVHGLALASLRIFIVLLEEIPKPENFIGPRGACWHPLCVSLRSRRAGSLV